MTEKKQTPPSHLEHLLSETREFLPPPQFVNGAHCPSENVYNLMYNDSLDHSEEFWLQEAQQLEWIKAPTVACRYKWDTKKREVYHRWFEDGLINVSYNCIDKHLFTHRKNKLAIVWQGENEAEQVELTYEDLHKKVGQCANALKAQGIGKGDRICLYLPMIPELAITMLACARIGAIHSVVFGGFSAESLAHRLQDCTPKLVITSNVGIRGGKEIHLKDIIDEAVSKSSVDTVWVIQRNSTRCEMIKGRDFWYHDIIEGHKDDCPCESLASEDPLFILYTSGSTGKPKGVVHTQAGYLLQTAMTHRFLFDIKDSDIYWCTADLGWVTGHSYVVYGPLANGTTVFMYEGTPTFPAPDQYWKLIEKYKITILYTAPTLIRTLIRYGEELPQQHNLSSLRLLGTVGEPINPEAWIWYHHYIGNSHCPVIDTWWQTETGAIMLSSFPACHPQRPGSAGHPFFGVQPIILHEDGTPCTVDEGGYLCISRPWPSMMRTTWGDHDRFIDTYFTQFDNIYFSGDGCRRDEDGNFWLLGRIDDVVNVSGHRLGTAEIESALVSHESVAEAAVVPIPHDIKGQGLYAYVTLTKKEHEEESLQKILANHVRTLIGAIAVPEKIIFVSALPKTRSGKIMRRILRKIAEKDFHNLGDTSTLADPQMLQELMNKES